MKLALIQPPKIFLVLLLLFTSGPLLAAPKVVNLTDVPVPASLDGSTLSKADVRKAIITAVKDREWIPVINPKNKDSSIIASILVRGRHYVEVDITYSQTSYSITYRNSREMKYNEEKGTIHKKYNQWINLLSNAIQAELSNRSL
jgi:hypothetical protein